ncbi:hypothetical protein SCHPADRAFT_500501 [Schizopora paradoxa]|uniref:Uncharacterized protein n=1 Tax=Schizopora paradoxa TaxID=27342 RepID=A0A0H2RGV8_9AGAM|nr:hypothetical protein SCHPADRAFT_500501 [Schizopora paradoxa]
MLGGLAGFAQGICPYGFQAVHKLVEDAIQIRQDHISRNFSLGFGNRRNFLETTYRDIRQRAERRAYVRRKHRKREESMDAKMRRNVRAGCEAQVQDDDGTPWWSPLASAFASRSVIPSNLNLSKSLVQSLERPANNSNISRHMSNFSCNPR